MCDNPQKSEKGSDAGAFVPAEMSLYSETVYADAELHDIGDIITALYRLSMAILNPSPRDRPTNFDKMDRSCYETFKIIILEKFPSAPEYLVKRLADANTRRWQTLECLKEHHEELAPGHEVPEKAASAVLTDTVAENTPPGFPIHHGENRQSITASASASADFGKIQLKPRPPINKDHDDDPFQCPHCFVITTPRDWKYVSSLLSHQRLLRGIRRN